MTAIAMTMIVLLMFFLLNTQRFVVCPVPLFNGMIVQNRAEYSKRVAGRGGSRNRSRSRSSSASQGCGCGFCCLCNVLLAYSFSHCFFSVLFSFFGQPVYGIQHTEYCTALFSCSADSVKNVYYEHDIHNFMFA